MEGSGCDLTQYPGVWLELSETNQLACLATTRYSVRIKARTLAILSEVSRGYLQSQDSSVGIATGYGLDGRSSIVDRPRDFYVLHIGQTDSGPYPASYPIGNGDYFSGAKVAGT
jgi:hypothetical protein